MKIGKDILFNTFERSLLIIVLLLSFAELSVARIYYFHPGYGNDAFSGLSIHSPFRTLGKAATLDLMAGDTLLLAAGTIFNGSLILKNKQGTETKPIVIGTYQSSKVFSESKAIIDAAYGTHGVFLLNCSHVLVEDLSILSSENRNGLKKGSMKCGVLVKVGKEGFYEGITLKSLVIKDVFIEEKGFQRGAKEVKTSNGSQRYGWGIRFINRSSKGILNKIKVENCVVKNVGHTGIKFTSYKEGIRNVQVIHNKVMETGGPGIQLSGVKSAHVKNNEVIRSGSTSDSRKWGRGSGLWTWNCSDILIEYNSFLEANGPGDSAGCHIDYHCSNVIVQYNLSAQNAGGFCEILGDNHHCIYRYNISVDDGYRVKGKEGAFQEGKIFWLSGYVGKGKKRNGPYNTYFYNNTLYVNKDIVSKIAISNTAEGVLIANNIFYLEGESKTVLGDQYQPQKKGGWNLKNVVFENNLFLDESCWPTDAFLQDENPFFGDPGFNNTGGEDVLDYIPSNVELIRDRGSIIQSLDKKGHELPSLNPEFDILGHKIQGKPDLGAIEIMP